MKIKLGSDLSVSWRLSIDKSIHYELLLFELASPLGKVDFNYSVNKVDESDKSNVVEIKGKVSGENQICGHYYLLVKDSAGAQLDKVNAFDVVYSIDAPVAYGHSRNSIKTLFVDVEKDVINDETINTEIQKALGELAVIKYEVVEALPQTGAVGTIYLLRNEADEQDVFEEYIYVNNAWEKLGNGKINLEDYYTKTEIDNKGYLTEHQSLDDYYTKEEIDNKGYLTEHQSLDDYYTKEEVDEELEGKLNKDEYQPYDDTEVKQSIDDLSEEKQDKLIAGTNIKTINGEDILGEGDFVISGGDKVAAGKGIYINENAAGEKVISTSWLPEVTANTYVAYLNTDGTVGVDYYNDGVIPYAQYSGNTTIQEVIIGDEITTLGTTKSVLKVDISDTFNHCGNLEKIHIGTGLTDFHASSLFSHCEKLKEVVIAGTISTNTSLGNDMFWYCRSLTSVVIPDGITKLGQRTFSDCSGISSIIIPSSVTSIGMSAFNNCSGVKSIVIPNSVTDIGQRTFQYCPTEGTLYCDEDWFNNLSDGQKTNLYNVANWTRKPLPKPIDERVDDIENEVTVLSEKVDNLQLFKFPNATIFGQPTIQNGQVSNFSNDNYLQFPFLVDFQNRPFVIDFSFTTPSDMSGQQNILDSNYGLAFAIRDGKVVAVASDNGTSWTTPELVSEQTLEPNTTYYFSISWYRGTENPFLEIKGGLKKGDETIAKGVITEPPYPKTMIIGRSYVSGGNYFKGSINLNDATLTISDKVVWTGMDDAGLATRAAVDLSNLDNQGKQVIKGIVSAAFQYDAETKTLTIVTE